VVLCISTRYPWKVLYLCDYSDSIKVRQLYLLIGYLLRFFSTMTSCVSIFKRTRFTDDVDLFANFKASLELE